MQVGRNGLCENRVRVEDVRVRRRQRLSRRQRSGRTQLPTGKAKIQAHHALVGTQKGLLQPWLKPQDGFSWENAADRTDDWYFWKPNWTQLSRESLVANLPFVFLEEEASEGADG